MKLLAWLCSKRPLAFLLLFLVLGGGATPALAGGLPLPIAQGEAVHSTPPVYLIADPAHSDLNVPPPAAWNQPRLATAASILVDFVPEGGKSFYGYTCSGFPPEAQSALLYAASIWESVLTSGVPIHVQACWAGLGPGVLGGAGPTYIENTFPGAQPDTYYPIALANALAGTDLIAAPEIGAVFNSAFGNFYFGTDGLPGSQYDFASVALHEIAHGLGFYGSMSVSGGIGSWGGSVGAPMIYDRFAQDGNRVPLLSYTNESSSLGFTLQGGVNGVYFSGPHANTANGGSRVKLYSPSSWRAGSSYSHLDTIYDGTANALMTYSLANGEVVHAPGPISLGLLADLGWIVPGQEPPTAPTGLSLSVISPSQINLQWTDTSSNETGFKVERSTDGINWVQIATLAANFNSYPNTGLLSGTQYSYRVRAYNLWGNSAYSNTAQGITQGPPQPPGSPSALAVGTTRIRLFWADASNIESGYVIRRSPDGINGWAEIHTTPPNATSYEDTGLSPGTPYFYQINTRSTTRGDSAYTSTLSATTWTVSYSNYLPFVGR